ncbi:MAG: hypothetical protein A4E34_02118 [Methanoregula sp. PtaU1.Bin006]|nr:MAG: hypothetical protein A4E34_02118 [Methanoregula sp. PtaU1.Bin006]
MFPALRQQQNSTGIVCIHEYTCRYFFLSGVPERSFMKAGRVHSRNGLFRWFPEMDRDVSAITFPFTRPFVGMCETEAVTGFVFPLRRRIPVRFLKTVSVRIRKRVFSWIITTVNEETITMLICACLGSRSGSQMACRADTKEKPHILHHSPDAVLSSSNLSFPARCRESRPAGAARLPYTGG